MATKIRHKRSSVAGKKPIVSQLDSGELAINTADGKVYLLRDDNTVQDITRRIFDKDTEVSVNEPEDSTQGTIEMRVDGETKFIASTSEIQFYDDVTLEDAKALELRELTASGLNSVKIKSPDTLPGSYTITLPEQNGINGQVLRLNSSGTLAFENPDVYGGNVIYVSAENGDDANDGTNAPVKTVKRACQLASGLVYDNEGKPNGRRINVKVAVGDYEEQNPIIVPDNVVIKGDGLRGCIIRPANANQDMLRVRNGCYFAEFTFRDKVDSNFVPLWTADYACAFDDPLDSTVSRVGYTNLPNTRPTITTSPYIQNCSILSFLGMNGAKIDGAKVVSPNIGLIPIEQENPVIGAIPEQGKSMVSNAFTMLSFGGTGWRLLNDAYAQIVSCFQIFMLNGVYCQSGGYCSITNSATNFGLYSLRSSGYSPKAFQFDRGYVVGSGIFEGLQTLTIIGINRETPVEEFIVRFRDPEYKIAYDLILAESLNIQTDTIDWIDAQIAAATPGSIWDGFVYDSAKCQRDLGIILDSIGQDTWSTGNQLTRQAALAYYNNRIADSSNISISGQEEQTIAALEQASVYTATVLAGLGSNVRAYVDSLFDLIKNAISDPDTIPQSFDVSSEGDITNDFKDPPDEVLFNANSGVEPITNVITKINHGLLNGDQVVYNANGNAPILGLDEEQTYYVKLINNDEFSLTFDDSLEFDVDIRAKGTGTHKFLTNIKEFFVEEVTNSHTTYQKLILESGAENYEFVPGRAITATTGAANNSAYVYSWKPNLKELIVSVELVSVGETTQRVQFTNTSIITQDHTPGSPNTAIGVNEVSTVTGYSTSTFSISPTVAGETLTNLINLPEKAVWLHRPSIVNSSSHTWEYAGSGTDYNALPQNGGNTRTQYEQFAELPGRVYSSGTNELGDFKVGDFITAFNRTGNITFRNKVQVDELDALRLSLSNVAIEEISTNVNLGDDELGGSSDSRLSTQLAVRSFLSNRLGGFIDKTVSTAAVPGAIVQLNTNGQLNPDLIPATRQFTNTNTQGYLSRLQQVDEIPAVDLKAGDIATEEYQQVEIDFDTTVSANDGDIISLGGNNAYIKGNYSNSFNMLVASIDGEFPVEPDSTLFSMGTVFINGVDTGANIVDVGPVSDIIDNFFLKSSNTSQFLVLDPNGTYTFTHATITNVSRNTDVATITTSENHNFNPGNTVQVLCNEDTTFNVNGTIIATPTPTTFTLANIGANTGSTGVTGTARTIVTSADGNAQGAVTETRYGVLTNVDNANITEGSGYTPGAGTQVYTKLPLISLTGSGTGATADITVTAGRVTDVDVRLGGLGYTVGDLLTVDTTDIDPTSTGSGFVIEVSAIENRAYVNILGGELFVASASSIDFVEDNDAVAGKITITLDDQISRNFLAGSSGAGGDVNYITNRITINNHGFDDGDPILYNTLGNVAIGGMLNGSVYYAKAIDSNTIEVYEDYSLLNLIEFLTTPANNNHNFTRYNVNVTDNSIIVPNHGLTTGDAVRFEEEDDGSSSTGLFFVNALRVPTGSRFFAGSVTTNSFTLHTLRSDALSSINGLVTNASNITATGTGDADVIANNVQVNTIVNTSSRIKANWNTLAVTNIDAENIISGTISPSRLASSGTANSETALFGDSSYKTVVQSIKKANTTDNPIVLTGSSLSGEFYGDPVNIGIANVDFSATSTYSTLGVARFFQDQFNVDSAGTGQVFIKDGVVDAGTLDGLDSSYFLNPNNLTSNVPVNRGGTNISTYAIGDIIFAQTTGVLQPLNIGRAGNLLVSNGSTPEWGNALDILGSLDVGAAKTESVSTATGKVYNENLTTVEIAGAATTVRIGQSSDTRTITSFVSGYDASTSQTVALNLATFTRVVDETVNNAEDIIPLASTSGIQVGMIVTGSASLQANTVVTGVTNSLIYINQNTVGTISTSTTLTFSYTPEVLGIRAGDIINIASSGITNLDGSWPVLGATPTATSFTIQTDANVTANPANPVAGTITKNNAIIIKNKNIILGDAESSVSPTDATIKGTNGVGTNIAGGDITIQPGLGTGNAQGGDFVIKTGTRSTSSDILHVSAERFRIDTLGDITIPGYMKLTSTGALKIPVGTTLQRPATLAQGQIRYNTTDSTFEGYDGTNWGSLGGVKDVDQDTYILAETSAGADNDQLDFYTAAVHRMRINSNGNLSYGDGLNKFTVAFSTGDTTVAGNLTITGDLTVNGTNTTLNVTTLDVEDLNITIAKNAANPTAANGAGITVGGANATITYDSVNTAWDSSEDWNLASGKAYFINDQSVLNSTTLGSAVVNSSLTTVGALNSGSITSGFGSINIGNDNLTATGTVSLGATSFNDNNITNVGSIALDTISGDNGASMNFASNTIVNIDNTTESSTTSNGALIVDGGVAIAKALRVAGIIHGNGSGLTTLNATNLSSGTIADARLPTTQAGKTFSSDVTIHGHTFGRGGGSVATNLMISGGSNISTGARNTGVGDGVFESVNVTGNDNVALGYQALALLESSINNVGIGAYALSQIATTTGNNVAIGAESMQNSITANNNVAIGYKALEIANSSNNVIIGYEAGSIITTGSNNIVIGYQAASTSNTTSNEITLGNSSHTNFRMPGLGFTINTTTVSFSGATGFSGVGSNLTALNASQLTSGTVPDARIAQTSVTQHQLAITGVGTLTAGSITNTFGNINIGTSTFTGNGSGLTTLNASNLSSGTVAGARLGGNQSMSGIKTFSATTEASSTITGAVIVSGGVGIAKNLHVGGTITGNGSGLTTLNASNLLSGTVPSARISGSYTGITGTGALSAGSITTGFGNINIGANTFTGNGSGLTNVNAATLDSIDSSQFLRSDANDSTNSIITFAGANARPIALQNTTNGGGIGISFTDQSTGAQIGFIDGYHVDSEAPGSLHGFTFKISSTETSTGVNLLGATSSFYVNGNKVWHAGNDGVGSGLDADTVQGQTIGDFVKKSGTNNGLTDIRVNDQDFIVSDSTDAVANFIWRDHSASILYLGTAAAVPTLRATLNLNSNNVTNGGSITATSFSGNGASLTALNATNITTGTFADRFSSATRYSIGYIGGNANDDYDKLRVYNSSTYTIGMKSAQTYGFLGDWAMTFTMNNDTDRGFLWRDSDDTASDGAMALTTDGRLTVKQFISFNGSETAYMKAAAGNYGTISTVGVNGTSGTWGGWSIADSWVFMSNGTDAGIYNDLDNEWAIYCARNGATSLYDNGVAKAATISTGFSITGEMRATGEVTAYFSDERLKTFNGKITGALDKVKTLNGYLYVENDTAKSLGFENDKQQVGVSAQEVQKVLPEAVGFAPVDIDPVTGESISGEDYLTVKYERLVPLLIEAIKEQDAKIENQAAEIAELKDLVKKLLEKN
jgi:hypothetical protein